jgi:UDP-N-acetylglucosamine--N-acetylmuramyl-(pentapeptide) pyrophosphoryl-undecaprenol N-acetylglucosamine transferase
MDLAYAAADLVVARAGATTVAELAVTGKPSLLVPLPIATVHQQANAEAMQAAGAGEMILDSEITGKLYPAVTRLLGDSDGLARMAERVRTMGVPDADVKIATAVMALVGGAK